MSLRELVRWREVRRGGEKRGGGGGGGRATNKAFPSFSSSCCKINKRSREDCHSWPTYLYHSSTNIKNVFITNLSFTRRVVSFFLKQIELRVFFTVIQCHKIVDLLFLANKERKSFLLKLQRNADFFMCSMYFWESAE